MSQGNPLLIQKEHAYPREELAVVGEKQRKSSHANLTSWQQKRFKGPKGRFV
jgi:hypothetical protein